MRDRFRAALVRLLRRTFATETIGQEECPMMMRWSLWLPGPRQKPWFKVLLHYFPPNVTDRDPHDHPRSFVTLILRGGYMNTEWEKLDPPLDLGDGHMQDYLTTFEWMSAGMVRYRPAEHLHVTETLDQGAWTLVVMGPDERDWGFMRDNRWWHFKPYIERFGGVIRCDAPPDMMEESIDKITYRDYKQGRPPT